MSEQKDDLAQFWRKYEVLQELVPAPQPSLQEFIPFLDVAYRTWLRSPNTAAQVEEDIAHHVELQRLFSQLREREHDRLRADTSRR